MIKSKFILMILIVVALLSSTSLSNANTVNLQKMTQKQYISSYTIKVHSSEEVHDKLHRYGYSRVIYVDRYNDYDHRPIYKFQACKNRKKYSIKVNWYGEILKRRIIGECTYG